MPPPPMTAAIVEQSAEAATATQAFVGAVVGVQFWPKAEAAAKQRFPAAMVKKRSNLLLIITPKPVAIVKSSLINRFGLGTERRVQTSAIFAHGVLTVNRNRTFLEIESGLHWFAEGLKAQPHL